MPHSDERFTGGQHWPNLQDIQAAVYDCGYCSRPTSSSKGMQTDGGNLFIRICPTCNGPTFFGINEQQWPGPQAGRTVSGLSEGVEAIYAEARRCSANAFTASVMLCRKILMHVAVEKGAGKGLKFAEYVKWLIAERYAPKGAETWLTYVRNRANEANHEIVLMKKDDAVGVLRFTEALLRDVYELGELVPKWNGAAPNEEAADEGPPRPDPES